MSYNEIIIIVGLVLAFGAIYAFGLVCWKQGHYAGLNEGNKVGYAAGRAIERQEAKWMAREAITSNLLDEACIQMVKEVEVDALLYEYLWGSNPSTM